MDAWKRKLSLQKILAGEKLGLSLYHAREAKPKLPTQAEQIALAAHIRLVELALKVTPAALPTTPSGELQESLP